MKDPYVRWSKLYNISLFSIFSLVAILKALLTFM